MELHRITHELGIWQILVMYSAPIKVKRVITYRYTSRLFSGRYLVQMHRILQVICCFSWVENQSRIEETKKMIAVHRVAHKAADLAVMTSK
jgi:hypothetical protein